MTMVCPHVSVELTETAVKLTEIRSKLTEISIELIESRNKFAKSVNLRTSKYLGLTGLNYSILMVDFKCTVWALQ